MSAALADAAVAVGQFMREHGLPAWAVNVAEAYGRVAVTVHVRTSGDADQWARHMRPDLTTENHVYADGSTIFEVAGQVADDGVTIHVQADRTAGDGGAS